MIVVRAKDVLARVSDLEMAGLRGFSGQRETIRGQAYVSLSSLAPLLTFEIDEKALVLRLTAQPALLGSTVVDLRAGAPPGTVYSQDTSTFLNYAVNWQDFKRYDLFGEAGLSIKGNLLFSSLVRNTDGDVIRGLTNYTVDDRQRLTRWVVGDSFASSGGLGSSLFLGGVSISRDFSLDPYFFRFPSPGLSAAILTPSTMEVYVNGVLVRQERLPPGQFDLRNLPVTTGSGVTRVIIRDAFGRVREISAPFYFTTGVLAPGLHEYSYNLGYQRNNIGTSSWDYDPLAFLGRHRVGLTDDLTAGLWLEKAAGLTSGGPTINARFPLGEIEYSLAASHKAGFTGGATSIGYTYLGRPYSLGGFARFLSSHYATLSLKASDERPWLETSAFVGFPIGSVATLSLQHTLTNTRGKGQRQRVALTSSIRLMDRLNLFMVGSRSYKTGGNVNELFIGLSYFLGKTTASLSHQHRSNVGTNSIELQHSLPVGSGFGYRFDASRAGGRDEQTQVGGLLQYQGPYGRYEASYNRVNNEGTAIVNVAGGLAAIGGGIYFTRPVQDSFALIRVPGVEGVRGYLNNQEIGRTDSRGNLLTPNLLPYHANRLSIADSDIPLDRTVEATEKIIAPPFRGGAVVAFPVQRMQSLTGTVLVEATGETFVPALGQLVVTAEGKRFESPIGRQGQFYLENVPAGSHPAVVEYGDKTCTFTFVAPASDLPIVKLAPTRCVAQ
ncbi:MAG: fimbrial biogenesis outer membrane usher protein [Deltaproteobacteria bacterium]|nr:fimbrial biogenesis outer membrane usher protein [Deltaproteobacteria bacterium]